MKSYGVTIQMKPLQQYFCMVPFVLTFESVDEILWCDHSNEASSAVLLHGAICFSIFYKTKFGTFLEFCFFGSLRNEWVKLTPFPALNASVPP